MNKATRSRRNSLLAETELASRLVEAGMPVYCSRLDENGNPHRPGWQNTRPSLAEVRKWKPGLALLAVTGHVYDVWDYDPRHDPDGSGLAEFGEFMEQANPAIYLRVRTRSGGWHFYTAALGKRKAKTRFRGVEYQGLGGGAFIPPTVRRSKEDPVKRGYEVIQDGLDEPLEVCDKLQTAIVESGSRNISELFDNVRKAPAGMRHDAFRDLVFRLQAFMPDDSVIQLAAPLYRELKWSVNNGTAENDVRGFLATGSRRPVLSEPGELDGIENALDNGRLLAGVRNGEWLSSQEFDPLVQAIPGILPAGVIVIAGKPFAGKGLLVLRFVLECARGGEVFGVECEERDSFYLALEDGDRRIQERCDDLLFGEEIPARFDYLTQVEPGHLIPTVAAWLLTHEDGIVVIDTLGKVMEKPQKGESPYDRDYRIMGMLTTLAKEYPGCTVVVNTHTRKAKAEDFVEMVSGTNAITGAADTVLVLDRKRGTAEGTLYITSRDLDEAEYALILKRPEGWRLDGGDTLGMAALEAERRNSRLDDRSQSVVGCVNKHPDGITPSEVATACGISLAQANVYLKRNTDSGYIKRLRRGVYGPLERIVLRTERSGNTRNLALFPLYPLFSLVAGLWEDGLTVISVILTVIFPLVK